ncbi:hypothetical protein [uncultured Alistipes sp.]|uniref:hypothetical protein n=2 Tax=uncultured Alistipes sp. TaxID=538949 RepID=UPI0025EA6663|nr:hypothetical protein [uncultured Alistipes sp.]
MSNQQQHKVLINKTYYHFHLIFPSSSPTFSLQIEQQLEESGTLQKTDTSQSAGRCVVCDGEALLAAAPHHPELRKKCSTRFIQKSSAHKMCPIRISDEEATTAPPESDAKREDRNDSVKTHR